MRPHLRRIFYHCDKVLQTLSARYARLCRAPLVSTALRALSAFQHATPFGLACQLLPFRPRPGAHEISQLEAVGFYARGGTPGRVAEVLTSRRAKRGGGLTSEGQKPERASGAAAPSWRVRSRGLRSSWRSHAVCRTVACGLRRRSGA